MFTKSEINEFLRDMFYGGAGILLTVTVAIVGVYTLVAPFAILKYLVELHSPGSW